MNIVIPLAGKGTRFKQAGYTEPKVLIDVLGKPMFYWALEGIKDLLDEYRVTFICLDHHLNSTELKKKIYDICPDAIIVSLHEYTHGQTETVLKAEAFFKKDEPLLIFNGDTYQQCSNIRTKLYKSIKGMVFVFESKDDSFSYVDVDNNNNILTIKEKKVISKYATTGLYYFPNTEQFLTIAKENSDLFKDIKQEYYISMVIEKMLNLGTQFESVKVEKCYTFGNPSEIEKFIKKYE